MTDSTGTKRILQNLTFSQSFLLIGNTTLNHFLHCNSFSVPLIFAYIYFLYLLSLSSNIWMMKSSSYTNLSLWYPENEHGHNCRGQQSLYSKTITHFWPLSLSTFTQISLILLKVSFLFCICHIKLFTFLLPLKCPETAYIILIDYINKEKSFLVRFQLRLDCFGHCLIQDTCGLVWTVQTVWTQLRPAQTVSSCSHSLW